jgi:hypothetical protein
LEPKYLTFRGLMQGDSTVRLRVVEILLGFQVDTRCKTRNVCFSISNYCFLKYQLTVSITFEIINPVTKVPANYSVNVGVYVSVTDQFSKSSKV